jgi:Flp pilus assembly pilin Flp
MALLFALLRDEEGASLVEYSVVIGLVAAATILLIHQIRHKVSGAWLELDGEMATVAVCQANPSDC